MHLASIGGLPGLSTCTTHCYPQGFVAVLKLVLVPDVPPDVLLGAWAVKSTLFPHLSARAVPPCFCSCWSKKFSRTHNSIAAFLVISPFCLITSGAQVPARLFTAALLCCVCYLPLSMSSQLSFCCWHARTYFSGSHPLCFLPLILSILSCPPSILPSYCPLIFTF